MSKTDDLLSSFDGNGELYASFAEKLRLLIIDILSAAGIRTHSVTARVKSRASVASKISRGEMKYRRIADITDVIGIRIITYFADDVDTVARALEKQFSIDRKNSVDKRALLDPDRFGYLSLHFVVTLPRTRTRLPEYSRFGGLKAEIQVRSILQHAWAEIEHDLGYKTSAGVPRDTRRQFSRLAGLLELADGEFKNIRERLLQYEREVPRTIERAPADVLLDKASLEAYVLSSNNIIVTLTKKIASATRGTIAPPRRHLIEEHLAPLAALNINSVSELEAAAGETEGDVIAFAQRWLGDNPKLNEDMALYYLIYVLGARSADPAKLMILGSAYRGPDEQSEFINDLLRTYDEVRASRSA